MGDQQNPDGTLTNRGTRRYVTKPTPEIRKQMADFVDKKQPGLLDDLGISRDGS